jgi:hypothetical protein
VSDLVRLISWMTVGLIGVGLAWVFVSGSTTWRTQAIWTAVGAAAVAIATVGGVIWLVSGFGIVGRERTELRLRTIALTETLQPAVASPEASEVLVWAPAMKRFHSSSCQLTIGKAVKPASRQEFVGRGIEPCGMCQP